MNIMKNNYRYVVGFSKIPFNYRSIFKSIGVFVVGMAIVTITWAAFSDRGKVLGSSFSVGSSDIKLLENLSGGVSNDNLKDEINGPNFQNITPSWTSDYLIKLYNNGSSALQLASYSNYSTANDPDDLRSYIFVEPFSWDDSNNNGIIDSGEEGNTYGKKSIVKWKTEGFDFGTMQVGEIKGLILRFTAGSLSDTKQGKSALYDFEFTAIQQ